MAFPLNVAIVSAVRTAVGRAQKGTLKDTRPDDLAATALREAVRRVRGLDPKDVDDVILGCAFPEAEQGFNLARAATFLADWPHTVSGQTINRFCSSCLPAIAHGALAVHAGLVDVVVSAGVQSMSMSPMTGHQPAAGEQVGFFVTAGDARNVRDGTGSLVNERSNVVVVPFPDAGGRNFTF